MSQSHLKLQSIRTADFTMFFLYWYVLGHILNLQYSIVRSDTHVCTQKETL